MKKIYCLTAKVKKLLSDSIGSAFLTVLMVMSVLIIFSGSITAISMNSTAANRQSVEQEQLYLAAKSALVSVVDEFTSTAEKKDKLGEYAKANVVAGIAKGTTSKFEIDSSDAYLKSIVDDIDINVAMVDSSRAKVTAVASKGVNKAQLSSYITFRSVPAYAKNTFSNTGAANIGIDGNQERIIDSFASNSDDPFVYGHSSMNDLTVRGDIDLQYVRDSIEGKVVSVDGKITINGEVGGDGLKISEMMAAKGVYLDQGAGVTFDSPPVIKTSYGGDVIIYKANAIQSITSGGDVDLQNGAGSLTVGGTVAAAGDVKVQSVKIGGDIIAGGDVYINSGSTDIGGDIYADGKIYVIGGLTQPHNKLYAGEGIEFIGGKGINVGGLFVQRRFSGKYNKFDTNETYTLPDGTVKSLISTGISIGDYIVTTGDCISGANFSPTLSPSSLRFGNIYVRGDISGATNYSAKGDIYNCHALSGIDMSSYNAMLPVYQAANEIFMEKVRPFASWPEMKADDGTIIDLGAKLDAIEAIYKELVNVNEDGLASFDNRDMSNPAIYVRYPSLSANYPVTAYNEATKTLYIGQSGTLNTSDIFNDGSNVQMSSIYNIEVDLNSIPGTHIDVYLTSNNSTVDMTGCIKVIQEYQRENDDSEEETLQKEENSRFVRFCVEQDKTLRILNGAPDSTKSRLGAYGVDLHGNEIQPELYILSTKESADFDNPAVEFVVDPYPADKRGNTHWGTQTRFRGYIIAPLAPVLFQDRSKTGYPQASDSDFYKGMAIARGFQFNQNISTAYRYYLPLSYYEGLKENEIIFHN